MTGDVTRDIDLNADVGESFGRWTLGDDDTLLTVVTSANVACGFHAGDPGTLRHSCEVAAAHGVAIGAQVSYRDLAGFGRRFIDVEAGELRDDVLYQLGALAGFAAAAGTRVTYVKPHGALYHAARTNEAQARAVIEATHEFDPSLAVLGLPGSHLLRCAERAGLRIVVEAFADRRYTADGGLVPRHRPDAVISDPDAVAEQVTRMVGDAEVIADDGRRVAVAPDSICVHGDSPGAVELARRVRSALEDAGHGVVRFS